MSRASEKKKARRKKRQNARDRLWIPSDALEKIEAAAELEEFDAKLTDRGWVFPEDDEAGVLWIWPDSAADVDHDAGTADATVIMLSPEDDGQIAHVVFVGDDADYQFNLEELFEHIEAIEAYRIGDPIPAFG
ncbi:hypothetical protein [Mycolicibacterium iranicum]|uniref:Knr4/Smi1-like domain-containing protein n=1 Tax=Mycolicibacterium iranicum TaxID=912594 RepID=A0ABT4HBP5_MYCIR|nr:hypothetical protein [Mycolicibacterium iranicum]MCZ0727605.1 hypothetical protein [Mycolicibacterium iranicum]